jgi:hypothetical protein
MKKLIKAVRDHAHKNYNDGGWDYVVECWEDSDIAGAIVGATTEAEAIERVERVVNSLDDYRREIRSTIW